MNTTLLLLVEGKDEQHVIRHLRLRYDIPDAFPIKVKEGFPNLRSTLEDELRASGLERLGVVVDADTDISSRWQSLRDILLRSGYLNVPELPAESGTVIQQVGLPAVGIWLMPDNSASGMLEDFVAFLVPAADRLWNRAGDCVQQIPLDDRLFPEQYSSKAHIHTWLAWQEEPGTPMGSAINQRYLDPQVPEAREFMNWICRLFNIELPH